MKVLYFHQYFTTPRFAGGTRSYEIAKRMMQNGLQVELVCINNPMFALKEIKKGEFRGNVDGVDVIAYDVPYSNSMGLFSRTIAFSKFIFKSVSLIFRENYDVIYATSTPLTVGIMGVLAKLFRRNKKFIFEVRDLWPELPIAMGMRNPFLILSMWILERLSYNFADKCVGLSPGIVEGIRRGCINKNKPIYMVPNACDVSIIEPNERGIDELDGISRDDFVAIFTGAHGIANGLYALLDVAKILKEKGRGDIKIVLIGEGKLKNSLILRSRNENLDNVKFFNPIPKCDLFKLIAKSDVGLMILDNIPAFYYGTSPNKFFDYLACGIPILTNYKGWVADIIRENKCGYYVEHSDSEAFADTLIKMADNKSENEQMRKNSRRVAENDFSRDTVLASLNEILLTK